MLIAIVVYLAIGAFLVGLCEKDLMEVVKDESLAMKIGFFTIAILSGPIYFIHGCVNAIYHDTKN